MWPTYLVPGKRDASGRISVGDVLGWFAAECPRDEIIDDFPELSAGDILACLGYAADRERGSVYFVAGAIPPDGEDALGIRAAELGSADMRRAVARLPPTGATG